MVAREDKAAPRDDAASRLVMALALIGGLGLLAAAMIDTVNLTIDDVFISFRYAENAARGLGWVFNPGEQVEGFSNLLWTMLLTALARAGGTRRVLRAARSGQADRGGVRPRDLDGARRVVRAASRAGAPRACAASSSRRSCWGRLLVRDVVDLRHGDAAVRPVRDGGGARPDVGLAAHR